MLGLGRDGEVVHPEHGAFFGVGHLDGGVFALGAVGRAVPQHTDIDLTGDKGIGRVVGVERLDVGHQLFQVFERFGNLRLVLGVGAVAQLHQRDMEHLAGIVHQQQALFPLRCPELFPAGHRLLDDVGVGADPGRTPDIGDGVAVVRVVLVVEQGGVEVLEVGQLGAIQRLQHSLLAIFEMK